MTMGVDTERLKKTLILIGSLMTAVAVSVSGIIGFVGLVVPHVCRRFSERTTGLSFRRLRWGARFWLLAPTLYPESL